MNFESWICLESLSQNKSWQRKLSVTCRGFPYSNMVRMVYCSFPLVVYVHHVFIHDVYTSRCFYLHIYKSKYIFISMFYFFRILVMCTSSSIQFPRSTFLRRILGALGTEVKPGPLGPMEQRWYERWETCLMTNGLFHGYMYIYIYIEDM